MDTLGTYVKNNHIPKPLATTLRQYFVNSKNIQRAQSYGPLLELMSPQLRAQTLFVTYSYWLTGIPFFRLNVRGLRKGQLAEANQEYKACVMSLSTIVKQVAFAPLETIYRTNQLCEDM